MNRSNNENKLINIALILSLITIAYNIIEGIVSIFFGSTDETLALFGFGVDSFVEVISGFAILHLVIRMKNNEVSERDRFERTSLLITGISFMLLTAGLIAGSIINIITMAKPVTTLAGIIISTISILTMLFLLKLKLWVGNKLNSDAIIADAKCTTTCFYLSIILLFSSLIFHFFKITFIDIAGTIGIAFFAFKEGLEAIGKSKSSTLKCSCHSCEN